MHLIESWLLNCKRKGYKIGVVIRGAYQTGFWEEVLSLKERNSGIRRVK